MSAHNPFRQRAIDAQALADKLNRPTAHEAGMAQAFPLGAGFGHGSARKRTRSLDASVKRAVRATKAAEDAKYLTALADAFDRGEITATGRRVRAPKVRAKTQRLSAETAGARLFIGAFPCGFSYADRGCERDGDYRRLAFLSYRTLVLEVEKDCPSVFLPHIQQHAATIQAKRGELLEITTAGQTVRLGEAV